MNNFNNQNNLNDKNFFLNDTYKKQLDENNKKIILNIYNDYKSGNYRKLVVNLIYDIMNNYLNTYNMSLQDIQFINDFLYEISSNNGQAKQEEQSLSQMAQDSENK